MKKAVCILLLIYSFSFNIFAQKVPEIKILTEDTREILPFVYISFTCLECKTGETEATSLTNHKGKVINPFLSKKTKIVISYLGYKKKVDTLERNQAKIYYLEPNIVSLKNIVVTAQYSPNSLEKAVHTVKVIDRERIDLQGAVTLKDVLTNESNIHISQDNVLGSSVSIQGVSGQNVKILIDGVPVAGRLDGNIDLGQINLNNIERIEIIEGPLSVEYGTNALGGTINLITKENQEKGYSLLVNSYYETAGQYNLDGSLDWKNEKNMIIFSGGRNYFDGWSPDHNFIELPKSSVAYTDREKEWNPKEQYFGEVKYRRIIKRLKLRFSSRYFKESIINKGAARAPYYETVFDDYYNTYRVDHSVTLNGKVAKSGNINILFARNDYKRIKNTYYKNLNTLEEYLVETENAQDTSLFNLMLARGTYTTSNESSKINFGVGYDITIETGKGLRVGDTKKQIRDYALFGSIKYLPYENLTIRPGVRYAYNTSYKAPLTPSINLRYKIKKYTLRSSYSKGFRAPSVKDLYFNFVDINHDIRGNINLNAETSNNYSLSLLWSTAEKRRVHTLGTSMFFNNIKNLITLAQSGEGTTFSYFNLGNYKTLGVQLKSELIIDPLEISATGTYTGRHSSIADTTSIITSYDYSPELRLSALYDFKKWGLQLATFYKYTGKVMSYYMNNEEQVEKSLLEDFQTLDITLTKSLWGNKVKWTVGGKNLFNVQNINSSNASGRHFSNSETVPMSWGSSIFTSVKINLEPPRFNKKRENEK